MTWIMNFVKFMQKRPTDKTILFWRIWFWLFYIALMSYNLIYLNKGVDNEYFFGLLKVENILIAKYVMISIWLVPVIMWITNICLLPKKYLRIVQIIFGIVLFYIAWSIKDSPTLDFDIIIWFMWLLPLIAWITWKCITTKCMKYMEKITKIRV